MFRRYSKGLTALVLAGLLLLFCSLALAEEVTIVASGSCGTNVKWQLNSAGVLTIYGRGKMNDYSFYTVPWYKYRTQLTSAIIQDGVTYIGDSAFYECLKLVSITLPDTITAINEFAFYGCSAVRYASRSSSAALALSNAGYSFVDPNYPLLSLRAAETEDGVRAFTVTDCNVSATEIVFPDGVTSIGNKAFYGCSSLNAIAIPDGVTSIGDDAFSGCSRLTAISIPDSVTSIGIFAFHNCSRLTAISIPDSVTSIGAFAFLGCYFLTAISIPDGVTSIGDGVFYNCVGLTAISIPDSVTSIGDEAFYSCSSLAAISIPDSVTSIGDEAFYGCSKLNSITIPENVMHIGDDAFYNSKITQIAFLGREEIALGTISIPSNATVYCHEFSPMDFWATDHGYKVVYLNAGWMDSPISVYLPDDIRMKKGESISIAARTFPENVDAQIVWRSSAPKVVSVDNGKLTALSGGEAVITAACGRVSDTIAISVYVPVDSFALSDEELWIVSKETAQLTLEDIQPKDTTGTFNWSSSNTAVLTVSANGLITSKKPGDAVVTVISENGVSRSCTVHVCYPVTAVFFDPESCTVFVGRQQQLTANVTANTQKFVNKLVTFTSSDESVAKVDSNGLVTALDYGTAKITATAANGVKAVCSISTVYCTHKEMIDVAVPATCTETGLTEGSHCDVCGEVFIAQEIISATGHSLRFEQSVYDMRVNAESDPLGILFDCGHQVNWIAHVSDNLTLIRQGSNSVTVSGSAPGVGYLYVETDDEFHSRASCQIIIHAANQLVLPSALTVIDEEAFTDLMIEEIVLSNKVERIGARAFAGCANLALINLPDGVEIAEDAFAGCEKLTILCTEGSTGHAYAVSHEIPYLILTSSHLESE